MTIISDRADGRTLSALVGMAVAVSVELLSGVAFGVGDSWAVGFAQGLTGGLVGLGAGFLVRWRYKRRKT
jgi:hypothetical protein